MSQPPNTEDSGREFLLYRISQLEGGMKELHEKNKELEAKDQDLRDKIDAVEKSEAARERKRLIAGISMLGSVALALGGILWNYRAVIFGTDK